jgi:hypothetical protein
MTLLQFTLDRLTLGEPLRCGALGMIPLLDPAADAPAADEPGAYRLFPDALRAGTVAIAAVSEGGSVPELTATNAGDLDVLLVDGEELLGAKQNRMVNLSILVPARRTIRIPVSCVERGRWQHRSATFAESPNTVHARVRAAKARQVSASLRHGARHADQMAVWEEIDRKAAALQVRSATGALADVYASYADLTAAAVAELAPRPAQVGAVFTVGGTIAGAELFDRARTFATYLPKLVRGYALDAIELGPQRAGPVSAHSAATFLRRLTAARHRRYLAIGTGEDLRFDAADVAGGALVAWERIVHLTAMRAA